jgi:hypothetical protein
MESEGKIRGGFVAGARRAAFMLEADSNEEVNQITQSLPAWGVLKVEATPLLSFETRLEHEQQALERLEASLAHRTGAERVIREVRYRMHDTRILAIVTPLT